VRFFANRTVERWLLVSFLALLTLLSGCGKKGRPLPPEPRGPLPPTAVRARQLGERILVDFVVPGPRGANPNQTPVRAELVRVVYGSTVEPQADPDAFRRRGVTVAAHDALPLESGQTLQLSDNDLGSLEDSGMGSTLRYGVRVLDRRGRPSALVVARDLVPIAFGPAAIGLTGRATSEGVRLSWTEPPGEGGYQYNLYRQEVGGPASRQPINSQPITGTEYRDQNVTTDSQYRYEIRVALAPDRPFREGPPSLAKTILAADRFAPTAPDGLVVVKEGDGIRLFWNPGTERDLAGYHLYRRIDDGDWIRLNDAALSTPSFLDRDLTTGRVRDYRATAIDSSTPPNESSPSVEESFELGEGARADETTDG